MSFRHPYMYKRLMSSQQAPPWFFLSLYEWVKGLSKWKVGIELKWISELHAVLPNPPAYSPLQYLEGQEDLVYFITCVISGFYLQRNSVSAHVHRKAFWYACEPQKSTSIIFDHSKQNALSNLAWNCARTLTTAVVKHACTTHESLLLAQSD